MKTIISTVVALLALAGPLKATLWTTPQNVSVSLADSVDATLNFSQFDSTLGTLVGVSLSYSTSFTGASVNMHNTSGSSISGTAKLLITMNSDLASTADLGTIFWNLNKTWSATYTIPSGSSQLWDPGVETVTKSATLTSANADITTYIGTGNFSTTINDSISSYSTITGSGTSYEAVNPTGLFFGTVSYNYISAVPEPGTWISGSMLLIFVVGTVGRSYWRRVIAKA